MSNPVASVSRSVVEIVAEMLFVWSYARRS